MERESSFFPQLTTQLVQAGELSGQLGTVLAELADYYEQQEKLRSFVIINALQYRGSATLYEVCFRCADVKIMLLFGLYDRRLNVVGIGFR